MIPSRHIAESLALSGLGEGLRALSADSPLQRLLDAARDRQKKGHHDTCSGELVGFDSAACDCGYDALGEALEAFP